MLGDSMRRRRAAGRRGGGSGLRWTRWLFVALVLSVAGFGAGYGVSVFMLFPPPPETGETVSVPELVGRAQDEAARMLEDRGLVVGAVLPVPHSRERGTVLAQSPVAGQRLLPGSEVQLSVSAGASRAYVPALVGLRADRAVEWAQRIGFEVVQRSEPAAAEPGEVIRVQPDAGAELELPARIVLTVSEGLPEPELDTPDPEPGAADADGAPARPGTPGEEPG